MTSYSFCSMKLIKVIVAFVTWDRALHVHHHCYPVLVHCTILLATYTIIVSFKELNKVCSFR